MRKEQLEFIKTVFPHVETILPFATPDNLEKLFERAQEKIDYELTEAQFE